MIFREDTPQGVISVNKTVVNQLIQEALRPFQGKVKLLNRVAKYSANGIYIKLSFSVIIGESIKDIMDYIMAFLSNAIVESLELQIDDIVLYLAGVHTKKGNTSPREIILSYRDYKDQTETEK